MEVRTRERADPRALWPEVRSIVALGTSYAPDSDPLADLAHPERAALSLYARRRDYHDVVKGRVKELAGALSAWGGVRVKAFVDTAPVMEKPLAAAAGLGWQARNTMLVSRAHGNWLLLGAIYTTAELPVDAPGADLCGSCRRCLDACPTAAFTDAGQLDARRCIAYLTIEHEGPIPREFRAAIGNRVFGCDDCLAVCPWNKFAAASRDARLALRPDLARAPALAELVHLDEAQFRARFAGTPIKRTGRERFVRNVLIAMGNSGRSELASDARARLDDPAPIVRGAAVWALSRLLTPPAFARLAAARAPAEPDAEVRAEWQCAEGSGSVGEDARAA